MYALIVSYWKQSTSHELLAVSVSRWKRFVSNFWRAWKLQFLMFWHRLLLQQSMLPLDKSNTRSWILKFWSVKVFCLYLFRIAEHLSVMNALNILSLGENCSIYYIRQLKITIYTAVTSKLCGNFAAPGSEIFIYVSGRIRFFTWILR